MTTENAFAKEFLWGYDFTFLKNKFQASYPCSDAEFAAIEEEFRRYMHLILLQDEPLAMIGKGVDEFWHTFIIFTPQYFGFCEKLFGEYIHHQPHTPDTPVPKEALTNFFDVYEREYGPASGVWTDGYEDAVIASLRGGEVPRDFMYAWSGWTGRKPQTKA